jgi:hypothetical protein
LYNTLCEEDQTKWTKEEALDHINTNRFFASHKLNRIFVRPSIFTNPPPPGEIGLLPYTTSHSQPAQEPTQNTCDIKPNELEIPVKPDELETPLPILEVPQKLTEPAEPVVKHGQGHPQKHPVTKNFVMENHLTSAGTSVRQSPPADILVLDKTQMDPSRNRQADSGGNRQVDSGGNRQIDSSGNQ